MSAVTYCHPMPDSAVIWSIFLSLQDARITIDTLALSDYIVPRRRGTPFVFTKRNC
jgi:hypothetical protein